MKQFRLYVFLCALVVAGCNSDTADHNNWVKMGSGSLSATELSHLQGSNVWVFKTLAPPNGFRFLQLRVLCDGKVISQSSSIWFRSISEPVRRNSGRVLVYIEEDKEAGNIRWALQEDGDLSRGTFPSPFQSGSRVKYAGDTLYDGSPVLLAESDDVYGAPNFTVEEGKPYIILYIGNEPNS